MFTVQTILLSLEFVIHKTLERDIIELSSSFLSLNNSSGYCFSFFIPPSKKSVMQ